MKHAATLLLLLIASITAQGQTEEIENRLRKTFDASYIPDGQSYRVLLSDGEEGEFEVTLFKGIRYRISLATLLPQANLYFCVVDPYGNELFNNRDHDNAGYWDLALTSTIDCRVRVTIDDQQQRSGIATMMIGYK